MRLPRHPGSGRNLVSLSVYLSAERGSAQALDPYGQGGKKHEKRVTPNYDN